MTTYNTAYKSGTLDGAPALGATTFAVSGFTPAAGDVGRLIVITSGTARLQHREITAVSGQNITVAHAWDTNPFIDPTADQRASDVIPASGDTFAISYDADDLITTDADMTLTQNRNLTISGIVRVENDAYIHFKNFNVEFDSGNIRIAERGGLIFGYYGYVSGEDGFTKDSCNILDIRTDSSGSTVMRNASDSFGMFDMYGGSLSRVGNPFWRLFSDSSDAVNNQVRIINVSEFGSGGGRIDGNRSILILSRTDANSNVSIYNPRSAVARIAFSAFNCNQAGYVLLSLGAVGRAVFPRLVNISTKLLRVTGTSGGGAEAYEIVAKKSEVDLIPAFATVESTDNDHTLRYGNLVRPKYIDGSGVTISTDIKTRLYDATNAFINEDTVTGGNYTELFVRHTDIPTTAGTKTLASGTQYAPYSLRNVQYGKQFTTSNISAEDTFEPNIVMLDDPLVTEPAKATALAYSTLDTAQKFYDHAVAWLEDNITDEEAFLVSRLGGTIDAGSYDVTIDPNAAAPFDFDGSTITIKASVFTGNITTTGTVSRLNGATVDGAVSDANGVEVLIETNTSEFGFYGEVDGVPLGAYVSGLTQKKVQITSGQTLKMVVGAHGYKSKYLEITTANTADGFVILDRESAIDITIPQATKNSVVAGLSSTVEAGPQLAIEVSDDFKGFTPTEFLSGFDYFIYTNSQNIAPLIVAAGSTDIYTFSDGTVTNFSPAFYVRLSNSITEQTSRGYYVPMVVVDGAPSVVSVRPNTSGLLLGTALWTKASANITTLDVLRIQDPLAKEVTLNTKASQTSVDAVKAKTDNLPADPAGVSDLPDVSGLSTSAELTVVNEGVKKASLGIPHNGDI